MQTIILIYNIYSFKCKRCINNVQIKLPPDDSDCTSDLSQWFHCANNKGLPDTVLSQAWDIAKSVSFVFHHRSAVAELKPINDGGAPNSDDGGEDDLGKKKTKKSSKFLDDEDFEGNDDDPPEDDSDEDFVL